MSEATEASGSTERWVIEVCQQLKLPINTADDDIFDAGATSLTIMRLIARAEADFGPEVLSPDEVVESSSAAGIAAAIRRSIENTAAPAPAPEKY